MTGAGPMNRHRDKRAALVLALLLVLTFVLGQARRADAERGAEIRRPVDTHVAPAGGTVARAAADARNG